MCVTRVDHVNEEAQVPFSAELAVAHTMPEYLPRAGTFIYSAITFQRRFRPVVVARRITNRHEFPIDAPILAPNDASPSGQAFVRRVSRLIGQFPDEYERVMRRACRRYGCALIHAHHGWSGRDSIRTARRLGIPLVTTFYGRDLALKRGRASLRAPYGELFAHGAAFVCEGPEMAGHLVTLGCPAERIRLVKIGIDLERFGFRISARKRPLVVLQAARLVEKKGVDLAVRAFAAARPRLGASELWIIGDGELREDLTALASGLGVSSNVRFFGECSYSKYLELSERASVCIQPSRTAADGDTEGGAPTVLIEMQARGIPVVATSHADIPSVVAAHEALVPEEDVSGLADALVHIAELDESEYRERALRGREHVEREHTAQHMAAALERVYDSVLDRSARAVSPEPEIVRA